MEREPCVPNSKSRLREIAEQVPGLEIYEDFVTCGEERELLAAVDASEWDMSLKRRTQHYGYLTYFSFANLIP